ncbi:hypothetical protein V3C99_008548 [Haemonchus contortus]
MSVSEPEPHAYIWARHHSQRSCSHGRQCEHMTSEMDTLCLMPSSMRVLCAVLCALLISSLAAAVFNSLQSNAKGSSSFCKRPDEQFRPNLLCPRETMFFYYSCCLGSNDEDLKCCAQVRVWLLIAIICVSLSCVIGVSYTIFWYCCVCEKANTVLATPL